MAPLNQRAARVIRSLMRDLHVADHVLNPGRGSETIVASEVVTQLEGSLGTYKPEPHPKDGVTVDDMPNVVVDEEGFKVAAFRFYNDAASYVAAVNGVFPCAEYCIEGEQP